MMAEKTPTLYPINDDQGAVVKDIQENYSTGFISLFRSIRKHWIWGDPVKFQWWIDILMECNHKQNKILISGKLIDCERGQSLNSLLTWAKRWRTNVSAVRRFLKLLESDSMIVLESVQKTTRLTVRNYETYQDPSLCGTKQNQYTKGNVEKTGQKVNTKTTQTNNTNSNGYNCERNGNETEMKRRRNGNETQTKTNNNDNNVNNDNKILYRPNVALTEKENERLISELGETITNEVYDYLSNYKIEKSYTTKDDNLTIRRWVIKAVTNGAHPTKGKNTQSQKKMVD